MNQLPATNHQYSVCVVFEKISVKTREIILISSIETAQNPAQAYSKLILKSSEEHENFNVITKTIILI